MLFGSLIRKIGFLLSALLTLTHPILHGANKNHIFWDKIFFNCAKHRFFFKQTGCLRELKVSQEKKIEHWLAGEKISKRQRQIIMDDIFGEQEKCFFTKEPHTYRKENGAFALCLKVSVLLESPNIILSDEEIKLIGRFLSASPARIECFKDVFALRGQNVLNYGPFNEDDLVTVWISNFGRLFINSSSREFLLKLLPLLFALAPKIIGRRGRTPTRDIRLQRLASQMLNIVGQTLKNPALLPEDFFLFAHSQDDIIRQLVTSNPRCPEHAKVVGALMAGNMAAI